MKKAYRILVLLVALVILTVSLSACNAKDTNTGKDKTVVKEVQKTEVVYWLLDFGGARTKHMMKAIKAFNEQNDKNIFVKVQTVALTANSSITTYDGKLLPAIVAGTAPDIICNWENHHVLVTEGIIQEITPFVENDNNFSMDQFYEQKVMDCYYNGKLYSLPFQCDSAGFLVWNEDLFKKNGIDPKAQPKTLDELDSYAERITELNDQGEYDVIGYVPWTGLNAWCVEHIFNAKTINSDGSPNVVNDRMIEAYKWAEGYVKKYNYDKVLKCLGAYSHCEIATGKLGMQYAWIEELNYLRNAKVSFNWSIGPFPKAYPDAEPLWLGGYFMSVTKDSKVAAEAVEFMKFYCGEPGSEIVMNSYLDEFGELTITSPNKVVTERYVQKMPDKYRILVTDILPQIVINRKDKLLVPHTYQNLVQDFRQDVYKAKGEINGMLADLQKKMEFEWQQWLKKLE